MPAASNPLEELAFTVSGRIARPVAEVYEAAEPPRRIVIRWTAAAAMTAADDKTTVTFEFPGC